MQYNSIIRRFLFFILDINSANEELDNNPYALFTRPLLQIEKLIVDMINSNIKIKKSKIEIKSNQYCIRLSKRRKSR